MPEEKGDFLSQEGSSASGRNQQSCVVERKREEIWGRALHEIRILRHETYREGWKRLVRDGSPTDGMKEFN